MESPRNATGGQEQDVLAHPERSPATIEASFARENILTALEAGLIDADTATRLLADIELPRAGP
jgi:hypothetical protein